MSSSLEAVYRDLSALRALRDGLARPDQSSAASARAPAIMASAKTNMLSLQKSLVGMAPSPARTELEQRAVEAAHEFSSLVEEIRGQLRVAQASGLTATGYGGSAGGFTTGQEQVYMDPTYQTSVADRQSQMDKIEQDMRELLHMIQDINALVYVQGEQLDTIHGSITEVVDLTAAAADSAKLSEHRASRARGKCCVIMVILIGVIAAIAVAIYVFVEILRPRDSES